MKVTLACNDAPFCVMKMSLVIILNPTLNISVLLLIIHVLNPIRTQLPIIFATDMAD